MVARKRRKTQAMLVALAAIGALETTVATAQLFSGRNRSTPAKSAAPAKDQAPPASFRQEDIPKLVVKEVPVNPNDAIAEVNGEVITRRQLSDECVARKGVEILETLIARKLIDQALRKAKLEVTAAEIDKEIDNIAQNVAHIGREAWLRTLDKEKGISPVQYARDIIYPALALRKLAAPRVQVTAKDMKDSFEAMYGEKLRCRIIMVDKLPTAQEIWEQIRKNPAGFEKLAKERSMDSGSRSLGGLLAEPITRHAYPQNVSDAAFYQLVDGDPADKDPAHKPKDGDFTGPIQVAEATWIILKREEVIPGQKVDVNSKAVRDNTYNMIYEVKLKEQMSAYFVELMRQAAIDNKLTGHTKLANEEMNPDHRVDGDVKLMSNPDGAIRKPQAPAAGKAAAPAGTKLPTPAAAPAEVVKQVEKLQRPATAPR
jgi:foldase protein PrsA